MDNKITTIARILIDIDDSVNFIILLQNHQNQIINLCGDYFISEKIYSYSIKHFTTIMNTNIDFAEFYEFLLNFYIKYVWTPCQIETETFNNFVKCKYYNHDELISTTLYNSIDEFKLNTDHSYEFVILLLKYPQFNYKHFRKIISCVINNKSDKSQLLINRILPNELFVENLKYFTTLNMFQSKWSLLKPYFKMTYLTDEHYRQFHLFSVTAQKYILQSNDFKVDKLLVEHENIFLYEKLLLIPQLKTIVEILLKQIVNRDLNSLIIQECEICHNENFICKLKCHHDLCISCYEQIKKTNQVCPFCRTILSL